MGVTTTHALHEAARFAGLPPSLCAHLWHSHAKGAIPTLASLATTPARQLAKARQRLHGLPWQLVRLIDRTLQHRARLHPENATTFKHGTGYVSGQQWTTIVLILGALLRPLRPIPFSRKRYGQT